MSYQEKYLKYKAKYLNLVKMKGGNFEEIGEDKEKEFMASAFLNADKEGTSLTVSGLDLNHKNYTLTDSDGKLIGVVSLNPIKIDNSKIFGMPTKLGEEYSTHFEVTNAKFTDEDTALNTMNKVREQIPEDKMIIFNSSEDGEKHIQEFVKKLIIELGGDVGQGKHNVGIIRGTKTVDVVTQNFDDVPVKEGNKDIPELLSKDKENLLEGVFDESPVEQTPEVETTPAPVEQTPEVETTPPEVEKQVEECEWYNLICHFRKLLRKLTN